MIKKINAPELKNENFLIIPIPFEDELLTSWMVRTVYAHKTHPHTFTNQYLNYRPHAFFITASDYTLDENMIKTIEKKSYYKIDIHSLMLKSYSGYLQENIAEHSNIFLSDLKYCPVCLREDDIPYYRKIWKTVFYNICHKHQCYLYECCPRCKTKLDISKMHNNELPYTHCYKCGFELKKGRRLSVSKKNISSIDYQNKIFDIIYKGYAQLGDRFIYSFLFLEVFVKFSKLILLDKNYKFIDTNPLFKLVKCAKKDKNNHFILKRINFKEQSSFFGLVMYIFDNYPDNLKRFILENRLTYHDMTTKMPYVPFWYEAIVNEITPRYLPDCMTVTQEEVRYAERYLKSIGKIVNQANLTKLLGSNFFSKDNKLKKFMSAKPHTFR